MGFPLPAIVAHATNHRGRGILRGTMSNAQIQSSRTVESEVAQPREFTKAVTAGTIGNVLEWFDFVVYGYFAPFIGELFFPGSDPLASMFAAFAVLAVGALSRPLGAVVFGWIGDREGRRTSLTATVWLMAGSTFLIGILRPTPKSACWRPLCWLSHGCCKDCLRAGSGAVQRLSWLNMPL